MEKIPFSRITRAELYINDKKQTLAQIKKETGATHIMNAGFYTLATFTPSCSGLTVGGKEILEGHYNGIAMKGNQLTASKYNAEKWPHYIGGFPELITDGKPFDLTYFKSAKPEVARSAARSALGLAPGGVVMECSKTSRTLDGLTKVMADAHCHTAINLDGGGSVQCNFNGKIITSTRKAYSYLLLWVITRSNVKKGSKGEAVALAQKLLLEHGCVLPKYGIDGKFGSETDAAVRAFQAKNKPLVVDGSVGPATWLRLEGMK